MLKFRSRVSLFIKALQILFLLCLDITLVYGGIGFGNVPPLIFATQEDIRLVSRIRSNAKPKVQILVRNLTQGGGLDINYAAQKLCWADQGLETIQCVSYNGVDVENKVEIIKSDLILPEGLACDWFTNKLYWTDSDTNKIEVATMDGEYRKVLIWSDIDQPRTIALVPMRGIMFWTDWGEIPKIERVGMNGDASTRKIIVSDNIFWPNGLTVDYEAELLYWIDGKLKFITSVDYNGKNRRTLVMNVSDYPFALTRYQNKLYWTDWHTSYIHMVEIDKNFTALEPKKLIHSNQIPMCIQTWDPSRQPPPAPGKNPCAINNGGCSHLCLLAPYAPGYTCACPIGIPLHNNRTCAPGPEEVLLYAVRTEISILYLDSDDYTHRTVPLKGINYSIAIDYDPVNGYLYWSDDEVKAIKRARLTGDEQQDVIVSDVHHPDGLAIDWVAGNLYWTDTGSDRIEVSRLNGSYRRVLVHEGLGEPRAIVVAPEHGWMFWSDWNEKLPKIERAALDGSDRIVLVNSSLGWPNGLTLDLENSKIYWCDAKIDKIEVANMDGSDRFVLISDNLPHTFGLSLMGDYIYWTDWQRRAIDRVLKATGDNRTTITDQAANVMGVKAVRLNDTRGDNPCRHLNGGCSQLCLNRPNNNYICACQMAHELRKDGRTCVLPDSFLLYARNQSIGRISIENGNHNKNDAVIPVSGIKQASSIDFDGGDMRMYWADVKTHALHRAYINGSDAQKVIELGARIPASDAYTDITVAIDWMAYNVYWTDAAAHKIEVARLDGSSRRALLWQNLQEPRGLALDPSYGYMYWSEWGTAKCIKRAAMDGSQQSILINNTGHAKGLTIDYEDRQLYWADLLNPAIHRVSMDGKLRKIIVSTNIVQPMALSMYKDRIFWTDWSTGEIYSAIKSTGEDRRVVYSRLDGISDLVVIHSSQHHSNQCSVENGGCSNLCFALPEESPNTPSISHTCFCPTHYTLQNDSCIAPSSFIIYSQRNSVVRLLPHSSDYPEAVLPIQGLNKIKAVDFDPVSHYLYWIEGKTHSIKRALDNGSSISIVIPGGSTSDSAPFDLVIDSLGRLLFWTCSVHDVINVTRLDNGSAVGIVVPGSGIRPRLLAIHPTKRWLFWTDNGDQPRLTRARLDGSQHLDIITTKQNITAIALDLDTDMVVWAEGDHVQMCNMDGDNKHSVSEMKTTISHLAVYGGSMYWFERNLNQLKKLDLTSGQQQLIRIAHGMAALSDLVSIRAPPSNHSCASHRCTHICIGNATTVECACPYGLALQDDRRTCSAIPECSRDYFTCGRNRYTHVASNNDCIPAAWRCDGQTDCQDSSDEMDCPTCRAEQFRCQNGDCVEQSAVCDGTAQCTDASDEARCCTKEEFKCPRTDVCIALASLCDGTDNCADGADESEAICSRPLSPMPTTSSGGTYVVALVVVAFVLGLAISLILFIKRRCGSGLTDRVSLSTDDQASDPLSPKSEGRAAQFLRANPNKLRNVPPPDVVRMSMLGHTQSSSGCYDRCHITGASSSTNGSSLICYPRETLNPPPSPATTAASSPGPRHRPYRHYRSINQPPPPTPCSTDVCDESDCNYPVRSRYDAGPIPPPPTPRSHCHSESCPPSPSSRSSTYFSPLPPPPSPVPSTPYRGYES